VLGLEEPLALRCVDAEPARDPVRDVRGRALAELAERRLGARVGGRREDPGQVLAERVGRLVGEHLRVAAVVLVDVADLADEVRLTLGVDPLDLEAALAADDDERAAAGERRGADDTGDGPDAVRLGRSADLGAALDEHDAERLVVVDGAFQEEPVARLEDVERQEHSREQDTPEREERQRAGLWHDQTVLCDSMATTLGDILTPQLVAELIRLADGPAVRGIAVLGSVARREASRWSDIDVESTVAAVTDKWPTRPSFLDARLVMSSSVTHEEQLAQLGMPDRAIWAVPAYASMRILVDRDRVLARLQDASTGFDYGALRPAATASVREKVGSSCEYVFKIRDGLDRRDGSKALHAAASLIGKCETIVAVAFLTPIPTENAYFRIIAEAAGPAWTAEHRAAFGLDAGNEFAQAEAAVRLFRETVRLVTDRLDDQTRAIVRPTLEIAP
jgi:hypothetical protein